MDNSKNTQLDDYARSFLSELLGNHCTVDYLIQMPPSVIDKTIKQNILERGRRERATPKFNNILIGGESECQHE